jgi:WD40 repeat protein
MALSPNGKIVASGGRGGGGSDNVTLWDVETRKVIAKWIGHIDVVCALCWSADGGRVASGSWDGTARVWDIDRGRTVLTIKTGHRWVRAVMYSPDSSKLATGGDKDNAVKIWDAKTGERLKTLKHDRTVYSLAWTSDGKKLISGSNGPIRIFDTATWQQIAILQGHTHFVNAISLSPNNRLLTSASWDKTARLWNLDTNFQVGPPLHHEQDLISAALSPDGKALVTACENKNAYAWDVHAILKETGLEDLLLIGTNIVSVNISAALSLTTSAVRHQKTNSNRRKSMIQEYSAHPAHPALHSIISRFWKYVPCFQSFSFIITLASQVDATQCPGQFGGVDELSPAFFAGMEGDVNVRNQYLNYSALI